MSLEEAIETVNSRNRSPWLQWGIYRWNDDYVIASSSFMKRHPDIDYVYLTPGARTKK